MLLKKIDDTITVISNSLDLQDIKEKNRRILNLTKTLSEIHHLEQRTIEIQNEFIKWNIVIENDLNIKLYKNQLKQLTELIDSGTVPTDREIIDIKYGLTQFLTIIKITWKDVVTKRITPIVELLDRLKHILGNGNQVSNVIKNLRHLLDIEPDAKSFIILEKWIQEGNAIISNLHLNEEINKFIEKVSLNKATVNDLSPVIFTWLKSNNLMESLKLSFHDK